MNISEALVESTKLELTIPESIDTLPAIAYAPVGKSNAHDALQAYASLPGIYEYATWLCIENLRTSIEASGLNDNKQAREKYLKPTGPALAGTATMVRYLSLLPYIYAGQRKDFAHAPVQLNGQLEELKDIAERSSGHLDIIARQHIGVSGVMERNGYLRSYSQQSRSAKYGDANHAYRLKQSADGLYVGGRFDTDQQIKLLEANWQHDHPGQKLRKVGCVALRIAGESAGANYFDTLWRNLVRLAATDERFYKQDLRDIATTRYESDY
jgi:hypothetical protein